MLMVYYEKAKNILMRDHILSFKLRLSQINTYSLAVVRYLDINSNYYTKYFR
jgi:hypothetical protein